MNNYKAILAMSPERMEAFLDQVYLTGLNTGIYAAIHEDDASLDNNPFDAIWLDSSAEEATTAGLDETGDEYMLNALVTAILRSAGISENEE